MLGALYEGFKAQQSMTQGNEDEEDEVHEVSKPVKAKDIKSTKVKIEDLPKLINKQREKKAIELEEKEKGIYKYIFILK